MPLKAFFFLLRHPESAEVETFRSLIFEERDLNQQPTLTSTVTDEKKVPCELNREGR